MGGIKLLTMILFHPHISKNLDEGSIVYSQRDVSHLRPNQLSFPQLQVPRRGALSMKVTLIVMRPSHLIKFDFSPNFTIMIRDPGRIYVDHVFSSPV